MEKEILRSCTLNVQNNKRAIYHALSKLVMFFLVMLLMPISAIASDDYPYKDGSYGTYRPQDVDRWNFYVRECTSFVAWRLENNNHVTNFSNWYCGVHFGNAITWGDAARSLGITVDSNPAVGSVALSTSGKYGHVAWVSAVNGDKISVEEYNYSNQGVYNQRIDIDKASFSSYIHIKDIGSTTLPSAPDTPTLQSPPNGFEITSGQSISFQWFNTGASKYKLELICDSDSNGTASYETDQASLNIALSSDGDTNWRWQVRSYSGNSWGDAPAARTFTVRGAPTSDAPSVYMADDKNGSGVNYTFAIGNYPDPKSFGDLGNDMISHIQVPFGLGVTVYENDQYGGNTQTFNEGTYNLEDSGWSNRISSFVVHDANNPPAQQTPQPTTQPTLQPTTQPIPSTPTVYMADDKHGSGVNFTFAIGNYPNPGSFGNLGNDMISHILVPSGLGVTVYENDQYGGDSLTFNEGTYNLEDDGWSDRISSFVVFDSYKTADHPDDYQKAYDQAYADAYAESYPLGFAQGYGDADLASGGFDPDQYEQEHRGDPTPVPTEANPSPAYQQGYLQGLTDGNEAGYAQGYTDGYVSADPVSEEEPESDDQTTVPSGISLVTGNELENASHLVNVFSLMRSDFDLRQGLPEEDTLRNILLSPLLLNFTSQANEYTGNDPQWIGCSYFPYEAFSMSVVEYLDADPDAFTLLLDEDRFYYPNIGCIDRPITLQKIEPIGNGYYQADGVLEGESGDDGSYTPLGYAYQAILRIKPDATYGFVMVAQHTSATAPSETANTGSGETTDSVSVEWLDCYTMDNQLVTVPAIGSVSKDGSTWAYVTGTILEDVPEILNRPKRDLWVEVYTRDGEPGVELLLTPCRSQTEFDELMEDIAQDGATNGTLCYSQNTPYIRFVGQRNTACILMVIRDIAYYYTFLTPTDELIANWVQAHAALGLPLDQIEQYALEANIQASGQTMATASPNETQTAIQTDDWKQLYLDYLQTHLTFDESDDFYIQILALQDYDLDGTPEMLLGVPFGDTSDAFFRGWLFTVKNGMLAQYHTDGGEDTLSFAYQLFNAKLSQNLLNEQISWVYKLYPVKRTRERVTFEPTSPVYGR